MKPDYSLLLMMVCLFGLGYAVGSKKELDRRVKDYKPIRDLVSAAAIYSKDSISTADAWNAIHAPSELEAKQNRIIRSHTGPNTIILELGALADSTVSDSVDIMKAVKEK